VGAAVAAVIAAGCFLQASQTATDTPNHPAATNRPVDGGDPPGPAAGAIAPPSRVDIPAIGLSATVVPVGLTNDGGLEVPPSDRAGWYRLGPSPGEVGPAVVVGHLDSGAGPAVFHRLPAARIGDRVVVIHTDGSVTHFAISATTTINKSRFPTATVFAPTDRPALRLITCTGPFDQASGHYLDSLIIWANQIP